MTGWWQSTRMGGAEHRMHVCYACMHARARRRLAWVVAEHPLRCRAAVYVCTHACMYVMHACKHACMYLSMSASMRIYTHTHTHTHTYTGPHARTDTCQVLAPFADVHLLDIDIQGMEQHVLPETRSLLRHKV